MPRAARDALRYACGEPAQRSPALAIGNGSVTTILLGALALGAGEAATGADLGHAAGVESRRQQTQLRFQQAIRASRASGGTAGSASRDRLERMRLDALGARQQREANALDSTLRTIPPAQAEGRRYHTLQRFEREQRLAVDRVRAADAASGPAASAGATDPSALQRLPDRSRPGRVGPMLSE